MNTIRSRQHDVGSEKINKTALSADDDKRIVLKDKIHTLAYGYKGTKHVGAKRLKRKNCRKKPRIESRKT